MEYEKAYVFEPEDARPAKKRKLEPQGLQASWPARRKACREAWKQPQDQIDQRLNDINATTIADLASFLDESAASIQKERIPTGLILAGPNSALRASITPQIAASSRDGIRRVIVPMSSNAGSNLKATLKSIIQRATSRAAEDDDEELDEVSGDRKGPKLLNYDLQILHEHVQDRNIQQVVIAFDDTEAFDGALLSELVELLGCWQSRIPFALLFNVATSVEFLQQRLSRAASRCLDGRIFDAVHSDEEIEQVFEALTSSDTTMYLGANFASSILERQTDYIQSIESFVHAAKYAYMSCYYANALSVFLIPDVSFKNIPKDHFEALRNLASFRKTVKGLIDEAQLKEAGKLLDSDQHLFDFAITSISNGRQAVQDIIVATNAIRTLQRCLSSATKSARSSLYIQAMSGKLSTSPFIRSLLLSLRKAPSDLALHTMKQLAEVSNLPTTLLKALETISEELERLINEQSDAGQPLRSEDDVKNATVRTTVIAQKVELSRQKSTLSKQDAAYTVIVRQLSETLESYFENHLVDPKTLAMHEVFVYDLRSPYREVFTPRPRSAIERALSSPHDYLDCNCCAADPGEGDEATLAASQPATAVLYQLYLESGALINASDLWHAFQAVVGDAQEDEQQTMALFQRALAELHYLGFVKSTRKRVDHIAKGAWRGL